jgi:hypothetical protein
MSQRERLEKLGVDGPVLASIHERTWLRLGEGIEIQVLRFSRVTGEWALYVRMQPGSRISPHKHLSAGEFFVTKGELLYDVGSAPRGTYGYEALGEIHNEARAEVETEYLFLGRGAVAFPTESGQIEFILDVDFLRTLVTGGQTHAVTERAA